MFKFQKFKDPKNKYDNMDVIVLSHSATLPEILDDFKAFLQASGFTIDGTIEYVEYPTPEDLNYEGGSEL